MFGYFSTLGMKAVSKFLPNITTAKHLNSFCCKRHGDKKNTEVILRYEKYKWTLNWQISCNAFEFSLEERKQVQR